MYTDVQKIIQELGRTREETQQTNKGLVAMGQKLMGVEENVRYEVWASVKTLTQNYAEPKIQKEPTVRASRPEMPYLGGTKVEYQSESSNSLPPDLVPVGDSRKLGVTEREEQKTPTKQDRKQEKITTPL